MRTLLLDTAGFDAHHLLVWQDDVLLFTETLSQSRIEPLFALLPDVWRTWMQAGERQVWVNAGPGSHTGVRAGLATAQGLALGAGVPVLPVPAFLLLRAADTVSGDALYLAAVDEGRWAQEQDDAVVSVPELAGRAGRKVAFAAVEAAGVEAVLHRNIVPSRVTVR